MASDGHAAWSELAAGYAMSSLDDADEATYLEHAATCTTCRETEHDLSEVLAQLAHATPAVTPPPSLKASIMRAVREDDGRQRSVIPITGAGPVIDLTGAASSSPAGYPPVTPIARRRMRTAPQWWAAVAAGVVAVALVAIWVTPRHKSQSIAARCAAVHCPVIDLLGAGQSVGAVMVLNDTVYFDAHGLPAPRTGDVYVLWSLSTGKPPVGVAAVHTVPGSGPVRAGALPAPLGNVSGFAVTEEHGNSVPAVPSKQVLASGSRA